MRQAEDLRFVTVRCGVVWCGLPPPGRRSDKYCGMQFDSILGFFFIFQMNDWFFPSWIITVFIPLSMASTATFTLSSSTRFYVSRQIQTVQTIDWLHEIWLVRLGGDAIVVYCLLFIVYCLLLFIICYLLSVVCCLLSVCCGWTTWFVAEGY